MELFFFLFFPFLVFDLKYNFMQRINFGVLLSFSSELLKFESPMKNLGF